MIKILYTIPNFITAGSGGAMLNIIKQLDENLFEPTSSLGDQEVSWKVNFLNLGIPLIEAEFCFSSWLCHSESYKVKKAAKVLNLINSTCGIPFITRRITPNL